MARTTAIAATSSALAALLDRAAATPPGVPGLTNGVEVKVAAASDLVPPAPGAQSRPRLTVFLHRVTVNAENRLLSPRTTDEGEELRRPIPLDLHYLVTAWAGSPLTQQRVLGWAVRVLDDAPSLPASLLNAAVPETFWPDETVELVWEPLTPSEEAEVWQVAQTARQPSASYLARMVPIESALPGLRAEPVQTTDLGYTPSVPERSRA